jgi:hypothetical protein
MGQGETAMRKLLALAALGEAATGLALLVYPVIVIRLLFGAEITGAGVILSRITGISLIALGLACWPDSYAGSSTPNSLLGMLCYSLLATLYLAYLGIDGEWVGSLLWPAVAIHAILAGFLASLLLPDRHTK